LLVRRRGFGTEVSSTVVQQRTELTSLFEDLQRNRRRPGTRVLELSRRVLNPAAAGLLRLPPDAVLVHLRRLRLAADVPVAVMENWLPGDLAAVTEAELTTDGLYNVLRQHGRGAEWAHQTIGAKAATTAEANLLGVRRGSPLLRMNSVGFHSDGRPVECGQHVYRADVYSIEVEVHADAAARASS
jgi:DNA-binding GntR family transcriptional regulator